MSTDPIVVDQSVTPPQAVLRLAVPADLAYFAGHFPKHPIVPGVVQLKWAIDAAERLLAVGGELTQMEALKFQRAMTPGLVVSLTLKWVAADCKLYFAYQSADTRFSSGRLFFGPKQ